MLPFVLIFFSSLLSVGASSMLLSFFILLYRQATPRASLTHTPINFSDPHFVFPDYFWRLRMINNPQTFLSSVIGIQFFMNKMGRS